MKIGRRNIFWILAAVSIIAASMIYSENIKNVEANPGSTFTILAGEFSSPFSYWGFEKSGSYTTIRLQTRLEYPVATYTFEELPVRIGIGGFQYDIISYDNTKITLERVL